MKTTKKPTTKKKIPKKTTKSPITTTTTRTKRSADAGADLGSGALKPTDEALYRVFQSNLLSLISHELRTPLMSIINALTLIENDAGVMFAPGELISIARKNSDRLNRSLSALLDLAAIESGTFLPRLREVDLGRLVRGRLQAQSRTLKDRELQSTVIDPEGTVSKASMRTPLLADPQKLGRAIDLSLHAIAARARPGSEVKLRIAPGELKIDFELDPKESAQWKESWLEAKNGAGSKSGGIAPGSAFAGTLKTEQQFLTRDEEGLGSEFLLIHEILRLHDGEVSSVEKSPGAHSLILHLPTLSSEEGIYRVLASRANRASHELSSVALGLIQAPEGEDLDVFQKLIQRHLFRSTDAAYALPKTRQIALVLDDCKPEDAPLLLKRIEAGLGRPLLFGLSACPSETSDPDLLIELANRRLQDMLE